MVALLQLMSRLLKHNCVVSILNGRNCELKDAAAEAVYKSTFLVPRFFPFYVHLCRDFPMALGICVRADAVHFACAHFSLADN